MSAAAAKVKPRLTAADLMAIPEHDRYHELIAGELVRKPSASFQHGLAQMRVAADLAGPYGRKPGGKRPGGWWVVIGVETQLEEHEVYRPDVLAWRRERMPVLPDTAPVLLRPDWVCEVLSPSNARNDRVKKMRVYHRSGVPHYWLVNPAEETLIVQRWTPEGYLTVLSAEPGDRVRAEPFADIELDVGALFGDEADEPDEQT